MAGPDENPHGLEVDAFLEEVHSFEFWFQAVEGYLAERPYGHRPDLVGEDLSPAARDALVTSLCNYCVGETAALEGASGMISFAPNRSAKIFLATQVVDEARHLEVLLRRLADLGVERPDEEIARRTNRNLVVFKERLLDLVAHRDWEAAVLAQNVILEAMEFTVFQSHAERADPITREVLEGIVKDERRHMGFGENALGRHLLKQPRLRGRLAKMKKELDCLVLATFEGVLDELAVPRDERPELGRRYLAAVGRLGLA